MLVFSPLPKCFLGAEKLSRCFKRDEHPEPCFPHWVPKISFQGFETFYENLMFMKQIP